HSSDAVRSGDAKQGLSAHEVCGRLGYHLHVRNRSTRRTDGGESSLGEAGREHQSAEDADRARPAWLRVPRVQDQARWQAHAAADEQDPNSCPTGSVVCVPRGEIDPPLQGSDSPAHAAQRSGEHSGVDKTGEPRCAWLGPPLQAGPRPKALPPTRRLVDATNLVAPVREMALLRLGNVATQQALRRVRACQSCRADPFHRYSEDSVFVKAGCGKTARPVLAADGGQRESNRARLLRPDSWEAGEQSGAIRRGVGGAKGGGQGECGPAKHVPDAEPGKRVTGAGTHTASIGRHTPEVGAVCGKAARTV